jgi:hypothetical protein
MDAFKILIEWRKKLLSPLDMKLEDEETPVHNLIGIIIIIIMQVY